MFTWDGLTQETIVHTIERNTYIGGYGSGEISYHEAASRLDIRIEVDSTEQLEYFLVVDIDYRDHPVEYLLTMEGPDSIRSGIAGDGEVVEWTVDREEFGDGTLYLVEDYSDVGDVPIPPMNTTYGTHLSVKEHIDPQSNPAFWVFVTMLIVSTILLIVWVRDSRRQGPEEQWMPSKAVMPEASTPPYGTPPGPPDR